MKHLRSLILALAVICFVAAPAHAKINTEEQLVTVFYAALLSTMKEGEKLGFEGRYKKLEPIVKKTFNLPLMTRYAIGPAWRTTDKNKRKALIDSFTAFSIATYASRFKKYDGEQFNVLGSKKTRQGLVVVKTELTPKGEEAVALNYLIRKDKQKHSRIADVYLGATISELATRRADFGAVIKRGGPSGIDKIIASLKEKVEVMSNKK